MLALKSLAESERPSNPPLTGTAMGRIEVTNARHIAPPYQTRFNTANETSWRQKATSDSIALAVGRRFWIAIPTGRASQIVATRCEITLFQQKQKISN
jgi:hypothetical protein